MEYSPTLEFEVHPSICEGSRVREEGGRGERRNAKDFGDLAGSVIRSVRYPFANTLAYPNRRSGGPFDTATVLLHIHEFVFMISWQYSDPWRSAGTYPSQFSLQPPHPS